jgi:hypothetical protein
MPCGVKAYKHVQQNPFCLWSAPKLIWPEHSEKKKKKIKKVMKRTRSSVLTCSKGINTPNAEDSFVPTKKALFCPATNTNLYLISLFWRFNYSILSVSSHCLFR